MRTRVLVALSLVIGVSCSGPATPSAQKSTPPATVTPSSSLCVGRAVHISMPCPLNEVGAADVTGQGATVHMTITTGDASFAPTFIKVKPGARITIVFDATASLGHNFIIESIGVKSNIEGFRKTTVSFTLPKNGPVGFFCSIHRSRGMQGGFYFS